MGEESMGCWRNGKTQKIPRGNAANNIKFKLKSHGNQSDSWFFFWSTSLSNESDNLASEPVIDYVYKIMFLFELIVCQSNSYSWI